MNPITEMTSESPQARVEQVKVVTINTGKNSNDKLNEKLRGEFFNDYNLGQSHLDGQLMEDQITAFQAYAVPKMEKAIQQRESIIASMGIGLLGTLVFSTVWMFSSAMIGLVAGIMVCCCVLAVGSSVEPGDTITLLGGYSYQVGYDKPAIMIIPLIDKIKQGHISQSKVLRIFRPEEDVRKEAVDNGF